MTTTIDYNKIYNALENYNGRVLTASGLAHKIGVERIYGGTMSKLVRDGYLIKANCEGYYYIASKCN